jgi:hypothetical protein
MVEMPEWHDEVENSRTPIAVIGEEAGMTKGKSGKSLGAVLKEHACLTVPAPSSEQSPARKTAYG